MPFRGQLAVAPHPTAVEACDRANARFPIARPYLEPSGESLASGPPNPPSPPDPSTIATSVTMDRHPSAVPNQNSGSDIPTSADTTHCSDLPWRRRGNLAAMSSPFDLPGEPVLSTAIPDRQSTAGPTSCRNRSVPKALTTRRLERSGPNLEPQSPRRDKSCPLPPTRHLPWSIVRRSAPQATPSVRGNGPIARNSVNYTT